MRYRVIIDDGGKEQELELDAEDELQLSQAVKDMGLVMVSASPATGAGSSLPCARPLSIVPCSRRN